MKMPVSQRPVPRFWYILKVGHPSSESRWTPIAGKITFRFANTSETGARAGLGYMADRTQAAQEN